MDAGTQGGHAQSAQSGSGTASPGRTSATPRHLVLFGFDLESAPSLAPHRVTVLPAGLDALCHGYDIFEADLVVMAPRRDLFAPPAQFPHAVDLAMAMHNEVVPAHVDGLVSAHEARRLARRDAALARYLAIRKRKGMTGEWPPRLPIKGTKAVVPRKQYLKFDPDEILHALVVYGTWLLRRSFEKGRAGPQDVIVFLPPCDGGTPSPAYEEHCTAALMDYWLGIPQFDSAVPADLAPKRLKWTPCAEMLKWSEFLDLKQMKGDSPFMQCVVHSHLIAAGAELIDDESGFELRHVPELVPAHESPDVIHHAPLIASPDGSVTVGCVYQINDMRIHVLPKPVDIAGTVAKFLKDRWGHDAGHRLDLDSGQPQMIKAISIRPCEEPRALPPLKPDAGDKRGRGWEITINDRYRMGMGETKFLQLLAFIAADRAGQTAGVSPACPRLGGKPIKNVFRPTDGCKGPEARRPAKPGERPTQPSTGLPRRDINKTITGACKDLGVSAQPVQLIISTGEKGFYKLNPEYASRVRVEITDLSAKDRTVKALIALVGASAWNPVAVEPPAAERLWYQELRVRLPSDLAV